MPIYFVDDPAYALHDTGPAHPERAERTRVVVEALEQAGIKHPANTIRPRKAKKEEVLLCHSLAYVDLVQAEVGQLKEGERVLLSTGDTPLSKRSFETALLAVGGVLCGVDRVCQEPNAQVFCIVRPPGHHACSERGMGFCLFNNVAIGARYAQKKYGLNRVLIVDWDVHHGNGTEEIFQNDPSVYYMSTHEKGLYPGTGIAKEKGSILNYPILPGANARIEVRYAFDHLKEIMAEFKPEMVLISAGFDAHEKDLLGHFNLTEEDFFLLAKRIEAIADEHAKGRIVSVLEGGYHLGALASSALAHVRGLSEESEHPIL